MKTVAVDCRFACTQSGLGRYTRELVKCLLPMESNIKWILLPRSANEKWIQAEGRRAEIIEAPFGHYSWNEQNAFPDLLSKLKPDLLFSPHFNVPFFCPAPFIATIHDLILHKYPNRSSFLKRIAYKLIMSRTVNKAKRIIAVSRATLDDLCSVYGTRLIKSKSAVIGEGVNPVFSKRSLAEIEIAKKRYGLWKPFFLYVGNAKEHKNVQTLIDAFESLNDSGLNLALVTSGPETAFLSFGGSVKIIPGVPDEDLAALYSGAKAFVTASLYEGFCLPAAEALACGCSVIAGNLEAIKEISKGSAKLVNPDRESLSRALQSVPSPAIQPFDFSWNTAAKKTIELISNL